MDASKKTVLLVEDDRDLSVLLQLALTHEGYVVLAAGDGEEGEREFLSSGTVDLVVTDISLPRVTGDQLYYRLHAIDPGVPVIACSGNSPQSLIDKLLEDGLRAFLPKPFRVSELVRLLASILRP